MDYKVTIREALVNHAGNEENLFNITGAVIGMTIEYVLDGETMTEVEPCVKTYMGTRMQKKWLTAWDLPQDKSKPLDTEISGIPVDLKFTLNNNWMIPPECVNQFCLLFKADHDNQQYSLGVFHAAEDNLTKGSNRDRKRSISKVGKETIDWLVQDRTYKRTT